jgi:peroxiredoxin
MPRLRYLSLVLAPLLSAAGCQPSPREVPRFDVSGAEGYGPVEFKDDAPANAAVDAGSFPLQFVSADGGRVDLTQYRGKKVVLVVLRGMARSERGRFCPSCLAQTVGLTANAPEFDSRGAVVLVVFPGPSERVGEFVQNVRSQSGGDPDRAFRLLLDRECVACDRLGIRDDMAKPSTYILDPGGNVVYAYVGSTSTDRPSIKAVLGQLDRIK